MILPNKLNIICQVELARTEEKVSKAKAKQLFDKHLQLLYKLLTTRTNQNDKQRNTS